MTGGVGLGSVGQRNCLVITCRFESGHEAALRHVVTDNIVLRGSEVLLVKRSRHLI